MPTITIVTYDKKIKRGVNRVYNTDAAEFICNVPEGRLLKRPRKCSFYIYNPRGKTKREQIRELLYQEARELIRIHGTREQFCRFFSILNPDGSYKTGKNTYIRIDPVHRIKLIRNASLLSMSMSDFVEFLIDKYDGMGIYNNVYVTHKRKGKTYPADQSKLSDLTS